MDLVDYLIFIPTFESLYLSIDELSDSNALYDLRMKENVHRELAPYPGQQAIQFYYLLHRFRMQP